MTTTSTDVQAVRKPRRKRSDILVPATTAEIVERLIILQRDRRFFLAQQIKLKNATAAYVARQMGYRKDMPEDEGKALWALARRLQAAIEAGKVSEVVEKDSNLADLKAVAAKAFRAVTMAATSRKHFDDELDDIIFEMETLAMALPAWLRLKDIRGFGAKGLAVIVAEAGGGLEQFATREKLWKRLCAAVLDGRRQGDPGPNPSAQTWIDHGYSKLRRSEVWQHAEPLLKAQWVGDRDEDGNKPAKSKKPVAVPAHANGHYGEVYAHRRTWTQTLNDAGAYADRAAEIAKRLKAKGKTVPKEVLEGRLTRGHLHNDALRVMSKALLEDVWRVWNGRAPRARLLGGTQAADLDFAEAA
jgi:hypothetical protein